MFKIILKSLLIFILIISPFLLITNVYFLTDPPVWPDEPVFYDMSQNLIQTGKMTANIYGGGSQLVIETGLGYPPLYFLIQGIWTGIFGNNIEVIRLLSVILAILTLTVFYLITKEIFTNKLISYLGTFLLSLNIFFLRASRLGRMEILALLLILTSFFFLLKFHKKHKLYLLIISSIISGLSAITHPLGFMSPVMLGLCIIFDQAKIRDKIINLLIFSIPVLLLTFSWIFTSGSNLFTFLQSYQMHLQDKAPKSPYIFSLFSRNFFWFSLFISDLIIFIMFIFAFIKNTKKYIFFLIPLVISFSFAFFGKEGGYMVHVQPFIIFSLLLSIKYFSRSKISFLRLLLVLVTTFFLLDSLIIQLFVNDNLEINIVNKRDYNYFAERVLSTIPSNSKATIFISSVPDPYFILKKNDNLSFIEAADPSFPIKDVDYRNILDKCDYIFATWFPHKFLSDYVTANAETQTLVGQRDGYTGIFIKLKPLNSRR